VDEFREVQKVNRGPGSVGWWEQAVEDLDSERVESLMAAATDRTISHRTISIVLNRWGLKVTPGQVGHWRRNHVG
jgi:hypothetical protein